MSKGALVRRIESLEAQLAAVSKGKPSIAQREGEQLDATATQSHGQNTKRNHHLHGVVRFLTLGHDSNEEQSYLGPSSGVSLVENVKKMLHYAEEGKLLPVTPGNRPQQPFMPDTSDETMAPPPDDETGAQIIDAYFKNTHSRLPFLNDSEILELHAKRYQPIGTSPEGQFGRFKLYMVYAVGSEVVQMSGTYESTPPRAFLTTALRFDPTFRESMSIASIEAMMLLVVHTLVSTSNSSVWYMIGLAMRTCIDFGLHRESRYQNCNPKEAESHRRLFWCVYIVERHTAWALGRPFSIPEEEIDVEPPSNIYVSMDTDQMLEMTDQTQPNLQPHSPKPKLGRFIATIRLQRIVSDIHTRIFRIDRPAISLLPEITTLMSTLQSFKENLPPLDLAENDFIQMHWNNAIRVVLQPFLGLLHPEDKLISTSLNASGQMCQLFKRIRQRDSTIHSFLLVNSIFAAGLTMW
ncbi:hypothetical protein N7478_007223 [Penicillium angulare]|uniref:uncharacterized protein n=1 Tax=Penicillium angulare TaxID=116970 RepID=UPI0025426242|nr:uncharacterized protein N7478_007223 [Penicillium angulare]KAJ5281851.1 hypothetical protein N7478_007223 [Penicillium angulare]